MKKGFLDKFKSLFRRQQEPLEIESHYDDESENDTSDIDIDSLPSALKAQLFDAEDSDDLEEEIEEEEDEIPQFAAMSVNKEALDQEFGDEDTSPSLVPPSVESTRETILPDDLEARLEAIRDGASDEDDQFEEHSGINSFKEFEIKREDQKTKQVLANLLGRLRGFAPMLKRGGAQRPPATSTITKKSPFSLMTMLFAPEERPKLHGLFVSLMIMCATYGLGKMMALYLESSSTATRAPRAQPPLLQELPQARGDLTAINRADLFNANKQSEVIATRPDKPRVDETLICVAANQASRLPITLVNTVVLQDSVKSIASVQVRGGKDIRNIREGQKIDSLAEVGKIDRMKLILKNLSTGQCEFVRTAEANKQASAKPTKVLPPKEGQALINRSRNQGIVNEGNSYKINKTVRDQMLENISEVLTQARAVQIQNPDGSMAFKMTEIVPGSIYSQLNIQDGDIIEGINGAPITNLNEVMSMFGRIREIDNLSLTIRRNGVSQNLDYSFD